tara:strand:+ start:210 stop:554 length:345 start_codon:yes stop_codon:yes gene_type:complete
LNIFPTSDMEQVFLNYLLHLNEKGLQKTTIKLQRQICRYFLDWLCRKKISLGAELFPSHPIKIELQNELLGIHIPSTPKEVKIFRNSYYSEAYQTCNKKLQKICQGYCENNGVL